MTLRSRSPWIVIVLASLAMLVMSCLHRLPQQSMEMDDGLLPLPTFQPCSSTSHPVLPPKWQATALMQDFVLPFMVVAKFTYDQQAAAFRFQMTDLYGGDQDFLVRPDGSLYALTGGEMPTGCSLVTTNSPYAVPSRDWLDAGAVCVGEAPILERNVAWWKTPRGEGADWIWYDAARRLPFRSMYYEDAQPSQPAPIYEYFTFNYFPTFEPVPATNLDEIVAMCESDTSPTPITSWDITDIATLVDAGTHPRPRRGAMETIQAWIPELSACSSPTDLPPPWPTQVQGSVFMTAVSFDPNPFPTRVFYDWTRPAQNTSLYYYPPPTQPDGDYVQVALLTGDTGYIRIEDRSGTITMCEQSLPGPQVPNWKRVDGCRCEAQIAPYSTLNPYSTPAKILWCPTDLSANQVFWTWYSNTGTPIVFMQTNSSPTAGTGLNLADYYGWAPGSVAPPGTFTLPAACRGEPKVDVPQACHNCHLPLNQ